MTADRDPSPPAGRRPPAPRSGPPDVSVASVVAARRGDPAAFARMVEHWDGHLRPFVHHTLGGEGSTDRVLAAAYVRAYRALPRYHGELAPGLWLHRIAYLAVTDELRRVNRDRARRRGRAGTNGHDHEDDHGEGPTSVDGGTGPVDRADPPAPVPGHHVIADDPDDGAPRVTLVTASSDEVNPLDADPDLWTRPATADPSGAGAAGRSGGTDLAAEGPATGTAGEPVDEVVDEDTEHPEPEVGDGDRDPDGDRDLDDEHEADASEGRQALPRGWRRLAPDQRALAAMVDLEGFSIASAAETFDASVRVVADRLGSARRVLARHARTAPAAPATSSAAPDSPDAEETSASTTIGPTGGRAARDDAGATAESAPVEVTDEGGERPVGDRAPEGASTGADADAERPASTEATPAAAHDGEGRSEATTAAPATAAPETGAPETGAAPTGAPTTTTAAAVTSTAGITVPTHPVVPAAGVPGRVGGAAAVPSTARSGDHAPNPVPLDRSGPVEPVDPSAGTDASITSDGTARASEWTTAPADEIEAVRVVVGDEAADDVGPARDVSVVEPGSTVVPTRENGVALSPSGPDTGAVAGLGGEPDTDGQIVASARAVLAALEVPEPSPRFWSDLGRRLLAERDTPAAPTLDPLARLARSHPAEPGFQPKGRKGRRARREQAVRTHDDVGSPAVTSLADQADWVRPRRPWGKIAAVVVVVLLTAGLVAVAVRIGMSGRIPDGSVTARELGSDVASALAQGPYQQVHATVDEPAAGGTAEPTTYELVWSSDGSWLASDTERIDQTTYDATTGVVRKVAVVGEGVDQTVMATEESGLAAGPPDPAAEAPPALADLRAVPMLMRSAGDGRAPATHLDDEETWTFTRTVPTGPGGADEHWRVIVRRADKLPLVIERQADGAVVRRIRLADWKLHTTVDESRFLQPLPADVQTTSTTHGFITTELAAAALLGRGPAATPAILPSGFELATVAVRPEAPEGAAATGGGANPPDVDVLSLGFQRGLQRITVTTRLRGDGSADWTSPFASDDARAGRTGAASAEEDRVLTDGRFNGTRVTISTDSLGRARLWGVAEGTGAGDPALVITVEGDLTASEAHRLAASLR